MSPPLVADVCSDMEPQPPSFTCPNMQIIDQSDSHTTSQCKLDDKSYHETLALIRGIEAAGGEAGFVEWAARNGYHPAYALAPATSESNTNLGDPSPISIRVTMGTLALHTFVRCRIPGWHGTGGSWGIGLAAFACSGTLDIDLTGKLYLEKFTAATVAVRVVAAGEGSSTALLVFADEAGNTVGSAVLSGLGIGAAIGFTGKFSWSEDQDDTIREPL